MPANWPLGGGARNTMSFAGQPHGWEDPTRDEETVREKHAGVLVVGTTQLYRDGKIRLIPVGLAPACLTICLLPAVR